MIHATFSRQLSRVTTSLWITIPCLLGLTFAASAIYGQSIALTESNATEKYSAEIRRTSYGITHIVAKNFGSLGFGTGYAFSEDNICVLADQINK